MVSRFSELEDRFLSPVIDGFYGEATRVVRKAPGEFFGSSENGEYFDVVGIVDMNPVTVLAQDQSAYDGLQPQLAGDRIDVSYDLSLFNNLQTPPEAGDEIWALTREIVIGLTDAQKRPLTDILGDPVLVGIYIMKLRVNRVDPDGIGRIVCVCTKAR